MNRLSPQEERLVPPLRRRLLLDRNELRVSLVVLGVASAALAFVLLVVGGLDEMTAVSPRRAARPEAASSVAPIALLSRLPASYPRNDHRTADDERHSVKPS